MPSDAEWTIGSDDAGVRLDKFLGATERLGSRSRAALAIERGKVFVNDAEVGVRSASKPLAEGDVVRVWMDRPGSARSRSARPWQFGDVRLAIVHEDDSLIVLDKPPGLLAVPLPRRRDAPSVFDELTEYLRRRPLVVHRIDRDTSGLVVFAKRADVQQRLKDQFRRHEAQRVYRAVVYGIPQPDSGVWRDHLAWDERAMIQKDTHPRDPRGSEAVSRYRVVESFGRASLLEIALVTGKRNQIRLQARLRGHTLVGERRYVYGPDQLRPIAFERQALHAWRLAFAHPVSGEAVTFEAPLADDMARLIAGLRRRARDARAAFTRRSR